MKSALTDTKWSPVGWAAAAVAVLGLLVAALLPPFVGPTVGAVLADAFRHLCHQIPGRSFVVDGTPFAVCHRCAAIYLGLAVGVLAFPAIRGASVHWARHDRWVLLAAVLPAALDWGGEALGVWSNTVGTRVGTGLWLGIVVGVVFARSVSLRRRRGEDPGGRTPEPVGVG